MEVWSNLRLLTLFIAHCHGNSWVLKVITILRLVLGPLFGVRGKKKEPDCVCAGLILGLPDVWFRGSSSRGDVYSYSTCC